jgi:hypothetical protein
MSAGALEPRGRHPGIDKGRHADTQLSVTPFRFVDYGYFFNFNLKPVDVALS